MNTSQIAALSPGTTVIRPNGTTGKCRERVDGGWLIDLPGGRKFISDSRLLRWTVIRQKEFHFKAVKIKRSRSRARPKRRNPPILAIAVPVVIGVAGLIAYWLHKRKNAAQLPAPQPKPIRTLNARVLPATQLRFQSGPPPLLAAQCAARGGRMVAQQSYPPTYSCKLLR